MIMSAFNAPGTFWRGNLHTHSDLSDGALPPEEVCRRYKAEGYDFIALTEHFIGHFNYPIANTVPYRDDSFTTILGAELHSGAMENGELWHILAVGLPSDFAPSNTPNFVPIADQETGPQIAARARAAGAFVTIPHPQWSGMTMEDARSITAAHAVEIYNHGCAVECDRADGGFYADLLMSEGRDVMLIATDDAHFSVPDAFGGWVMVKAEANDPDLLLEALKLGDFYASTGPELRGVEVTEDEVIVTCSAASFVAVQGHGSVCPSVHGASMTRAVIPRSRLRNSPWIRVTVIDAAGKRAWSNPIRF
jgi:hypothetical protein